MKVRLTATSNVVHDSTLGRVPIPPRLDFDSNKPCSGYLDKPYQCDASIIFAKTKNIDAVAKQGVEALDVLFNVIKSADKALAGTPYTRQVV